MLFHRLVRSRIARRYSVKRVINRAIAEPLEPRELLSADVSGWVCVDSLSIGGGGNIVKSTISLGQGEEYRIVASGTLTINKNEHRLADAEFFQQRYSPENWIDVASDGSDTGLGYTTDPAWNVKPVKAGIKWASVPDLDGHEYVQDVTGQNGPMSFKFFDNYYADNTGSLNIKIYRQEVHGVIVSVDKQVANTDEVTFTLTRTGDVGVSSNISYQISAGELAEGTDYVVQAPAAVDGVRTAVFAAGEITQNVTIHITAPVLPTTDQAIVLMASSASSPGGPVSAAYSTLKGVASDPKLGEVVGNPDWKQIADAADGSGRFYVNTTYKLKLGEQTTTGLKPNTDAWHEWALDVIDKIPGSDKITTWSTNLSKCFSLAAATVKFKYANYLTYTVTNVYKFDYTDSSKALVVESTTVKNVEFSSEEVDTIADGQNIVLPEEADIRNNLQTAIKAVFDEVFKP